MLSIIIPTLNEELFLPRLLESLKEQTYKDFETIVADSNSKDATVAIARSFGAEVVIGKNITNPAMARNLGATIAKGDLYLFLDSDVVLPPTFIEEFLKVFTKKKLDGAIPFSKPINDTIKNAIVSSSTNLLFWISQFVRAWGGGWCILVKKQMFDEIGGFDEEIVLGEDSEFVFQIARRGKYRCLSSPVIHISFRRHEQHGYAKVLLQQVSAALYQLVSKGIIENENEIIRYRFGNHQKEDLPKIKKTDQDWIKKQVRLLKLLDEKLKISYAQDENNNEKNLSSPLILFFHKVIKELDSKVNKTKKSEKVK